jgi:hypothetical protein
VKDKQLRDRLDRLENSYRLECAFGADYRKGVTAQILERAEANLATLELVGVLIQRVNKLQERLDVLTVRTPRHKITFPSSAGRNTNKSNKKENE